MVHANIRNNEIIDFNSMYLDEDIIRIETTQKIYDLYKKDSRSVLYQDGEIVENPEYESIIEEEERQNLIENIKQQLNELDLKSVRAIRSNDTEYLEMYETQAQTLRVQLAELTNEDVKE